MMKLLPGFLIKKFCMDTAALLLLLLVQILIKFVRDDSVIFGTSYELFIDMEHTLPCAHAISYNRATHDIKEQIIVCEYLS